MGGEFKYCIISLTTFEVGSSAYNTLKESMKKIAKVTKVLCTPALSQWSQVLFEFTLLYFKVKTKLRTNIHANNNLPESENYRFLLLLVEILLSSRSKFLLCNNPILLPTCSTYQMDSLYSRMCSIKFLGPLKFSLQFFMMILAWKS